MMTLNQLIETRDRIFNQMLDQEVGDITDTVTELAELNRVIQQIEAA